ncbi:hypothetical protein VINI7043_22036 [Vibrio nigripulchritudo ATCC 27043]|uniref:hypothetical protein n=1 Tax=Vibrio nigripulchritudo TaxID=28173 RepID=UPI00021C2D45|nr:hypothetical protein [Vibrio nigripulchritudo]EGU61524.1 hypothetical protein VINI7043_22036 [Vibrio nigripulchritudo ATCC 27043]
MKIHLLFVVAIFMALTGCSNEQDCFVADNVTLIKQLEINSSNYFLYERVSGMSDKMSIVELYREQPSFDECGDASAESISQVPLDIDGNQPTVITVSENFVDILYSDQPYSDQKVEDLKIEILR